MQLKRRHKETKTPQETPKEHMAMQTLEMEMRVKEEEEEEVQEEVLAEKAEEEDLASPEGKASPGRRKTLDQRTR